MEFNLIILPLETIDSISYQKCLIPKSSFPCNAWPGQWAKCYFSEFSKEKQNYAVAQIFPRTDLETVCYLDIRVSNYDSISDKQLILKKLLFLEKKEIANINVTCQLNPQYFIKNSKFLTKSLILELIKTFLQQYHLTSNCLVMDRYFLVNGIDFVRIEIEEDFNYCYLVTAETNVNIRNISLTNTLLNQDFISVKAEPFVKASHELDNLMEFVRLQPFRKNLLCLSLNALLVGAVGCGKTTIVNEFLRRHHCNIFCIEITNCLKQYPGETEAELRKIFKAACDFENKFKPKDPTIILLEDIHLLCPQSSSSGGNSSEAFVNSIRISSQLLALVDELFASRRNIICLATTSNPDKLNDLARRPGRFEHEISIVALQEQNRSDIIEQIFKQDLTNFNIPRTILEMMAKQTQGYVISDLALLVRNAIQIVLTQTEKNFEQVIVDLLKNSKSISLRGSDVTAYRTTETFDSIGGMLQLKKKLEVSVLAGLKQETSYKRFGLSLPKGVLLYGPPGCAKTTIAKCLANEANMTFIATSGAEVYSPYVGCAEKFIMKIFQTARKNVPCLIFLDEIDSLVGRRSLAGSSSGDVQMRILSTLLTEMDGVTSSGQSAHILVVAATNRPDIIDDALMRPGRFDKLIHVPAPDLLSRRSILNLCRQKMPFSKFVDLDAIALETKNFSGADICNVCNEAALLAFKRDFNANEILMEDFENVLKTTKSSLIDSQIDWYYQFENKYETNI